MSKILDLAKTFKQTSQQEAESIEQQAKNDLAALGKAISAELKQSGQIIAADIRAQQLRMSKAVFSPYLWSLGGLLAVALVLVGANAYLAKKTGQQWAEYQEAKDNTDKMDKLSKRIQLSFCEQKDGEKIPCVAVQEESLGKWGNNGEYRAILPRTSK